MVTGVKAFTDKSIFSRATSLRESSHAFSMANALAEFSVPYNRASV